MSVLLVHFQNRISLCSELLLPKFSYLWSTPTKQSIADLKSKDTLIIIQSAIQKLNKLCSNDYDMDKIKTTLQSVIQNGEVSLPRGMKILRLAISGQKVILNIQVKFTTATANIVKNFELLNQIYLKNIDQSYWRISQYYY